VRPTRPPTVSRSTSGRSIAPSLIFGLSIGLAHDPPTMVREGKPNFPHVSNAAGADAV
jgi:hypothetical protein